MARKLLSGKALGKCTGRLSLGARNAHLRQFGFPREQGFRRGLCTGTAIPWTGATGRMKAEG